MIVATAVIAGSVDTRSSPETKGADEVSFFAADAELSSTRPLADERIRKTQVDS